MSYSFVLLEHSNHSETVNKTDLKFHVLYHKHFNVQWLLQNFFKSNWSFLKSK
jgi:hypothetical protein